jgi:hypothetical protein
MESQCYYDIIDEAEHYLHMPRNEGMILEAANVCRLNDSWLVLESAGGNRAALNWLREQFPQVKIEMCNFYAGVHIDSTIVPIREGLVLLNGTRVNDANCPKCLNEWDKIYVDDVWHRVLPISLCIKMGRYEHAGRGPKHSDYGSEPTRPNCSTGATWIHSDSVGIAPQSYIRWRIPLCHSGFGTFKLVDQ